MSETDKPFTVSDRRHFTADGRPREETESVGAEATQDAGRPASSAEVRERVASGEGSGRTVAGPADFSQFLVSLGAQASLLLSGRGVPEGAHPEDVLEGARSIIGILEMLRDKTEGRRTKQEDEVVETLLFELRMAYVEKARAGGS